MTDLGFKTAAQWITEMLQEIRKNYLSSDKESQRMNKKLQYAIEKLNSKRGLFNIDNQVTFYDEPEPDDSEPAFMSLDPRQVRKPRG